MPKYSISAIHRITKKSRTTITKQLKSGELSFERDASGAKVVDAAELIRFYGAENCDFTQEEGSRPSEGSGLSGIEQGVQPDLYSLRIQLEKEIAEREREREQYREQVEHLQQALKLAQEGHNKAMLLLEHGSGKSSDWEKAIKSLEDRIANQETNLKSKLTDAVEKARVTGFENALDLPWWKLLSRHKNTAA